MPTGTVDFVTRTAPGRGRPRILVIVCSMAARSAAPSGPGGVGRHENDDVRGGHGRFDGSVDGERAAVQPSEQQGAPVGFGKVGRPVRSASTVEASWSTQVTV
ncbi:MAG: hypothetical protein ABIQ18_07845 [Umezawaea sp.]